MGQLLKESDLPQIKAGDILHIYDLYETGKGKFVVLLNSSPICYLFIINSNPSKKILNEQKLLDDQLVIYPSEYRFLKSAQSYINCSETKMLNSADLLKLTKNNKVSKVSELTTNTKQQMLTILTNSKNHSKCERNLFKSNLS